MPVIGYRTYTDRFNTLDGNRGGTADIGDDDGRANISRTIALSPSVLGEDKSIKTFAEVLNHVVPLGLAVDEKIKTDLLLEGNDALDLLLDELLILLLGELTLAQLGTRGTDLLGLGEGSNGGSGELGQVQLLLDLLTNSERALPLQLVGGDCGNPFANGVVGGVFKLTSLGD